MLAGAADPRARALADLRAGDGLGAHGWTKSWVTSGGGAYLPDPWLLYAAADLTRRQPRGAVHSLDLGLRHWIDAPSDRAVLLFSRGQIIRLHLHDPKTALADLREALDIAPDWLAPLVRDAAAGCEAEAAASRKRIATVKPRPTYVGTSTEVAPAVGDRAAGEVPSVWTDVEAFFSAPTPP